MKIKFILILILLFVTCLGCNGGDSGNPTNGDSQGDSLGSFTWTYYWIVYEDDYDGPQDTPVYDISDGNVIANARSDFVDAVSIEGTGYLLDGRMINLYGSCAYASKCFFLVDMVEFPYGVGSNDNALVPFRSVSTDPNVVSYGTKLYIPALVGIEMPGDSGFIHDGCVIAADTGVSGSHLDFFAEKRSYYEIIDSTMNEAESVEVYNNSPNCP